MSLPTKALTLYGQVFINPNHMLQVFLSVFVHFAKSCIVCQKPVKAYCCHYRWELVSMSTLWGGKPPKLIAKIFQNLVFEEFQIAKLAIIARYLASLIWSRKHPKLIEISNIPIKNIATHKNSSIHKSSYLML